MSPAQTGAILTHPATVSPFRGKKGRGPLRESNQTICIQEKSPFNNELRQFPKTLSSNWRARWPGWNIRRCLPHRSGPALVHCLGKRPGFIATIAVGGSGADAPTVPTRPIETLPPPGRGGGPVGDGDGGRHRMPMRAPTMVSIIEGARGADPPGTSPESHRRTWHLECSQNAQDEPPPALLGLPQRVMREMPAPWRRFAD